MTGLQEATDIIAIVYMGISLLVTFGVLIALGVIRKKIISLELMVKEKLDTVTSVGARAGEVISTVRKITKRKGK